MNLQDAVAAATKLIRELDAPPGAHSIYVRACFDADGKPIAHVLMCHLHPSWVDRIKLPETYGGFPIEQNAWTD